MGTTFATMRIMSRRSSTFVFQSILHDIAIVALSVLVAVLLVQAHVIDGFLAASREFGHIGSFISGMFFTSIFTTAPAIVTLGEISQRMGVLETALWGALGAVVGDMLIFRFVKDRVSQHLTEILSHQHMFRRLHKVMKYRMFRYLTFLLGGLIIASPLPDELGISLLGMSKMREIYFVPLSFAFNFAGIVVIGLGLSACSGKPDHVFQIFSHV